MWSSLFCLDFFCECLIGNFGSINSGEINFGACGQSIWLVDSFHWHSIKFEWTGHGKEAWLQLLKNNNSFSLESSCQEYKDFAWLNTLSDFWGFRFVSFWCRCNVVCWVPSFLSLFFNHFYFLKYNNEWLYKLISFYFN